MRYIFRYIFLVVDLHLTSLSLRLRTVAAVAKQDSGIISSEVTMIDRHLSLLGCTVHHCIMICDYCDISTIYQFLYVRRTRSLQYLD